MRPFSCGTQYYDWQGSNCERCKKATWEGDFKCDIQRALSRACFGDGEISEGMARRAGITEENRFSYVWPCSEVDWTEEWKAEYEGRLMEESNDRL